MMAARGERRVSVMKKEMRAIILKAKDAIIDYIEVVHPETLEGLTVIRGDVLAALAVKFGKTRLIDNLLIKV
jgi:pantoate--beta-alanine ligase